MKLSLMYEIQIPKPWSQGIEARTYGEVLEQVQLGDRIGCHAVWAVEHHLLPEWSHCPAPEVLFGALSQITKKIRLGHGIALLPRPFNHAMRVAERAAVLDILSGGRVDLGTGRGVTLQELGGFEVEPSETKTMWEEAVEVMVKAWGEETFEHRGKYYNIPPSSLVPKPVQAPHPPLWLAGTNPDSFGTAGQKGLGILGFVTGKPDDVAMRVRAYHDGIKQAKPLGRTVNNQCAVLIQTYCAPTREQAIADVTKPLETVAKLSAQLYLPWAEKPAEQVAESYRYLTQRPSGDTRAGASVDGGVAGRAADGMIAVGTPDDLIKLFRTYQKIGVDQMLMWVQFGGLEHAKIMQSLEMIGKHVIPELAKVPA